MNTLAEIIVESFLVLFQICLNVHYVVIIQRKKLQGHSMLFKEQHRKIQRDYHKVI